MTTLAFTTPGAGLAAVSIICNTSLRHLVTSRGPIRALGSETLTLELDDDWRWSSGEVHYVKLIRDLAESPQWAADMLPIIKDGCDEQGYAACVAALGHLETAAAS